MKVKFALLATVALAALAPQALEAQGRKDSVTIGMVLEPPGLDPSTGAAAAIAEITVYNLFEGLTKVTERGEVEPLLAESWTISEDRLTYTFKLRKGVKFHDGAEFDASDVKFNFERNAADGSLNKRKGTFANMAKIETPDPHTVVITLKKPNSLLLYNLGEATAAILDPASAADAATKPVGTGPFRFQSWNKGSSVTLVKADTYREPAKIRLNRVNFRFINDPAAMIAATLAGDVDLVPNFPTDGLPQIKANP
ncbi:MAG: ABC transporter substrate-binding protein, partial [Alphaproteobacteria bacterium]|nr:ABC transporter substrate-binding protein [Alphaproteobacteria bacterium]